MIVIMSSIKLSSVSIYVNELSSFQEKTSRKQLSFLFFMGMYWILILNFILCGIYDILLVNIL